MVNCCVCCNRWLAVVHFFISCVLANVKWNGKIDPDGPTKTGTAARLKQCKAMAVDGARLAFNMVGRWQRREHGVVDGQRVVATSVWSFKTMAIAVKNRFSGMPL